jgi:Uma2 family endonuclease
MLRDEGAIGAGVKEAVMKQLWTEAEYLAFERASEIKHEYDHGEIFAMEGASEQHNLITVNVAASLHAQLRQRPCWVYSNDMRLKISARNYTYPDIIVVCGAPQIADEQGDTLLNPTLIVEVLSPSTEQYDRGRKFQYYRTLASLQEYVLISQEQARIEHYVRQDNGKWLYTHHAGLDAALELPSIGCRLALADVYEKVTFDDTEGQEQT